MQTSDNCLNDKLLNHDNEAVAHHDHKQLDEPKPEHGWEYIPSKDTVPKAMEVSLMTKAILKKINEMGSKYEGARD